MKQLPKTIDMRITGKCNLNCDFCFGTKPHDEIEVNEWFKLLNRFKKDGVENLVITGGEPLVYPQIIELLEGAKERKFNIVLSTNGLLFTDKTKDRILSVIDWISIPIDGRDYSSYRRMRNITYDEYMNIFGLLEYIKSNYPDIGVKVGTVVTYQNAYDIKEIFNQIKNYCHVWKLYQVVQSEKNKNIYNLIKIPSKLFNKVCNDIKTKNPNFKIIKYENYKTSRSYMFCEPNGDAVVKKDFKDIKIGNFISSYSIVLNSWHKYIDKGSLINNFNTTYTKLQEELYGEH